jgi:hypothetical protein
MEAGVEQNFPDRPAGQVAMTEQPAGGGICETDRPVAANQQKRITQCVEQAVALLPGLGDPVLGRRGTPQDLAFKAPDAPCEAPALDDPRGGGRKGHGSKEDVNGRDHSATPAT